MEKIRRKAASDLSYFFVNVFPWSFTKKGADGIERPYFIVGDYVRIIANFLQHNKKTIRVGPRDHLKSTGFYANIMWKVLRMRYTQEDHECHYYSYREAMATYHLGKATNEDNIKDLIKRNPFFEGCDDSRDAESIALWTWDGENHLSVETHGLLEFTRGVHTRGTVYVDDPLMDEDPHKKVDPVRIRTINHRMKSAIYSMPQYDMGAELHIVGTPQTEEDFYFDPDFVQNFCVRYDDAIQDESNKVVLFPEFRPWDWLMSKKSAIGEKLFNQEYRCRPVASTNSYVDGDRLKAKIDSSLHNYADLTGSFKLDEYDELIGGLDIGKHTHPSHFALYQLKSGGEMIQRISKWMDGWDYTDQINYIRLVEETFGLDLCYYDNTRGEFESLAEIGELPSSMRPVGLSSMKRRHDLARAFVQKLEPNGKIKLIEDDRQTRQILVVDSDLKARETQEGHGDSFWSNVLTMESMNRLEADIGFA